jgi:hypothetical protein
MSERSGPLSEIDGRALFPAPEAIQNNLDYEARVNGQKEKKEIRTLESTRLRGDEEIDFYRNSRDRLTLQKVKSLNGLEDVKVDEDNGSNTMTYFSPSGEKTQIMFPEVYLSGQGGQHYTDTKADFERQWTKLPEKFRNAYAEFVDWRYLKPHTGIQIDALEERGKIDPFHAKQIRTLAMRPDLVVLGAQNLDNKKREWNFYWAVMEKESPSKATTKKPAKKK